MRALLSVMPFSGHVAPLAGFAEAWLAAGHDLTVYTGTRFADRFPGARVLPWRNAPDFDEYRLEATFPGAGHPGPRGMLANVREIFIGTATGQARDLLDAVAEDDYAVLLGDVMSLGTGLTAQLSGLPWCTLSIVALAMMGPGLPPPGLGLAPGHGAGAAARDAVLRALIRTASRPLDRALTRARREVGLEPGPALDKAWYSTQLTLLTGCPALDYHRRDLPESFRYIGRLPHPAGHGVIAVPPGRRPLVLVTQGTFNTEPDDLARPAARALADADTDVVITTGRAGVRDLGEPVARNVQVVDFADFDTLLPRCSAVVTNAGWGGVLQALSCGVPLVLAGGDLDKPEVAARVAATGAGINLKTGRPTPGAVRLAVDGVLGEPGYRQAAARLAPLLPDGRATAVRFVEDLATGRLPPAAGTQPKEPPQR